MKQTILLLLLAIAFTAAAQEQQPNLGLIPTPQCVELDMSGKMCVWKKAKVKEVGMDNTEIDISKSTRLRSVQANVDQAYVLKIEPKQITIEYYNVNGDEGLKYAYMTLEQLRLIHGDTLPCCTITDWPAYHLRGWMDDQSRGPVPHDAYRQRQWNTLHALKFNFCNYYTEHTLYQYEFPDLAPAYAATRRHPDEFINLQLFAHAEKTLRIPFYQNMMDSRTNFDPSSYHTYDFILSRIFEAIRQNPTSPYFIINCDETEQLGTGRARHYVDSLGTDKAYIDYINLCYDFIEHANFNIHSNELGIYDSTPAPRVAMWGDIVAKNPAMMKQLPKDMIYIMWAYEPLDSFDQLVKPFKEQGNPFWVASSASHSSVMMPAPQRYTKNIANLYRDGLRGGAEGAMITCWDDNGEALFDNCWHALYWAAEMSWNPLKTNDPEEFRQREKKFNENYKRLFYRDIDISEKDPIECIYTIGALAQNPDIADWYVSSSLLEPLLNINPSIVNRDNKKMEDILDKAEIALDSTANPHAHYAFMRMLGSSYKLDLQQAIHKQLSEGGQEELCRNKTIAYFWHLMYLKHMYLHLWDQENGDYERYIVMNRYDRMAQELLDLDRHVFTTISTPSSPSSPFPLVSLRTLYNDRPIYYTLDGSEPTASSTLYTKPFPLERSATIKAISYNEFGEGVVTEQYLLSHLGMGAKITLNTPYSTYKDIYSGGGSNALIDGQLGSNTTYADGHWQGYWGDSIDAVIDFGEPKTIHEVSMRFMQNTFDWILAPWDIILMVSDDGKHWTIQVNWPAFNFPARETGMRLRTCSVPIFKGVTTRYLRVIVPNPGPLPSWHPAPGQPSYLFTDEIIIK